MDVSVFKTDLLPVSTRKTLLFRRAARLALGKKKLEACGDLNIIFMKGREMRTLNKKFLNHDYDTDVIAFPYEKDSVTFGDVFVSVAQAQRQARELKHPLLKEVLTLIIHGTLHLMGYQDDRIDRKKKMFREQDRLLKILGVSSNPKK